MRPAVARSIAGAALASVVATASGVMPAGAAVDDVETPSAMAGIDQEDDPPPACSKDFCVEDERSVPADPAVDIVQPSAIRAPAACTWRREPPAGYDPTRGPTTFFELQGEQTPTSYVVYEFCGDRFSGRLRWVTPAEPAPLPAPGELAETIYVRLEGNLPVPVVAADPAPGQAAIISVPTFVEVTNWTGTVTDRECDPTGVLCVAVNATPTLSFVPGEPASPVIECAGAGTRFIDGGASSEMQAAQPGACAYAYRYRTGVGSRPAAWPGEVTVTWSLTWTSTSGDSGVLPDVAKSTALERQVTEVQTVIDR
jgi:hypothetical protein